MYAKYKLGDRVLVNDKRIMGGSYYLKEATVSKVLGIVPGYRDDIGANAPDRSPVPLYCFRLDNGAGRTNSF